MGLSAGGLPRSRGRRILAWSALFAVTMGVWLSSADARALPIRDITIQTQGGPQSFHVEVAATEESREHGLMNRKDLSPRHGMLFEFEEEQPVAFWMKNTLIPLDMLFIDRRGRILRIHKQAEPLSETPIPSGFPVRAVLEIGGGESDRLGIAVGDTVVADPLFPASP